MALEPGTRPALFEQLELASCLAGHHLLDIADAGALAAITASCQPQVVFHLAAQPLVQLQLPRPVRHLGHECPGLPQFAGALKPLHHSCAVVMVTTDKVYANQEWDYGYREEDRLGGHDPHSSSKAAAELAIASWRSSFCGSDAHQTPHLAIATARAGNVIGGGDWAQDRILPDAMRSLADGEVISVRRPGSTRPWQHTLEPLGVITAGREVIHVRSVFCNSLQLRPKFGVKS